MRAVSLALGSALALTGCSTYHLADLTVISSRYVPHDTQVVKRAVRGRSCQFELFGLPDLQVALDKALASAQEGQALTNAVISLREYYFLIGSEYCFIVTGDLVRLDPEPSGSPAQN